MTLFIILPSSNECKSLFNTRAFYCSERIFIVKNPYCVTGFDIIPALTSKTVYVISQELDLTLLYADWTCREIDCSAYFISIEGSSAWLGYSRNHPTQCVVVLVHRN
jgi:hypothetical protein